MRFQHQLITTDLRKKQYGDCYRTCIANILDVPVTVVPHVFADAPGGQVGIARMREWLGTRGMSLAVFPVQTATVARALSFWAWQNPHEMVILTGMTRKSVGHAVLIKGSEIIHDPNPARPGVKKPFPSGRVEIHAVIHSGGVFA